MRARKFANAGFTVATLVMLFWLFISWFGYSMDTFDCPAFGIGVRECGDTAARRLVWGVLPAVCAWTVLGWLTFRQWGEN